MEIGATERKGWKNSWLGMKEWGMGAINFGEIPIAVRAKVCAQDCLVSATCMDFYQGPSPNFLTDLKFYVIED